MTSDPYAHIDTTQEACDVYDGVLAVVFGRFPRLGAAKQADMADRITLKLIAGGK